MTRPCRVDGCPRNAAPHKTCCYCHGRRIRIYGDPHTTSRTLSYPDEVRAVVEDRLPDHGLTYTDRITAIRQLTGRGVSAAEIAGLLGVTERTVYRWRAQHFREAA